MSDVDGEQVVAALGVFVRDLGQEELGRQPLALQAALHVRQRQDHRVDLAGGSELAQLGQGQHPRTSRAHLRITHAQADSSCSMAASSASVPWTFGPLNHLCAETSQEMPA